MKRASRRIRISFEVASALADSDATIFTSGASAPKCACTDLRMLRATTVEVCAGGGVKSGRACASWSIVPWMLRARSSGVVGW